MSSRALTSSNDTESSRSGPLIQAWSAVRVWCSGSGPKSDYLNHDENLAQRMFWCGCFGFPWLWFVNVLYFRTRVYGKIPYWDTGDTTIRQPQRRDAASHMTTSTTTPGEEEELSTHEDSILDPVKEAELAKWVKRSTAGCFIVTTLFLAWNILFQSQRSSFSEGWLVMSPDEYEVSGW